MIEAGETANFETFRECLSTPIIEKFANAPQSSSAKRRRKGVNSKRKFQNASPHVAVEDSGGNDVEELADFVDYLAKEIFTCLPIDLRNLSHYNYTNTSALRDRFPSPLSSAQAVAIFQSLNPEAVDTLTAYDLIPVSSTPTEVLYPILNSYIAAVITAPLLPSQTKDLASGCEICGREHIPLTYHHLVPKFVHEKAVKRGWHTRDQLNNVAWLCRACHSFVHHVASHEELAKDFYTVDLLMEREDVRRFAKWVGRVRWKAR